MTSKLPIAFPRHGCDMTKDPRSSFRQHLATRAAFLLAFATVIGLTLEGCGQTAKTNTAPTTNEVRTYFGSPIFVNGDNDSKSSITIDRSAGHISQSDLGGITQSTPTALRSGTFVSAPTGFLSIVEGLAPDPIDNSGVSGAFALPCLLHGAWALEIPGVGAMANLLLINSNTGGGSTGVPSICANPPLVPPPSGAPLLMAENSTCPDFPSAAAFLYVTVPGSLADSGNGADFGTVMIKNEGNAVTFAAQPFTIGKPSLPASKVTGGCSISPFGTPITSYPLNSQSGILPELFAISTGGFFIDSGSAASGNLNGALGQNNNAAGAIGVMMPSNPVSVSAVVGAAYNGLLYAPLDNTLTTDGDGNPILFDASALASAYGDNAGNSPACMVLQKSIAANLVSAGNGGTIAAPPSVSTSLFGGEFKNSDPSGASGMTERCDVAIDLGLQDPQNSGIFPNATVFIGQNYPPATDTSIAGNPCVNPAFNLPCAFAFPAAAIVGQVQGQFVIFVTSDPATTPFPQLPLDASGTPVSTPVAIYLFRKSH